MRYTTLRHPRLSGRLTNTPNQTSAEQLQQPKKLAMTGLQVEQPVKAHSNRSQTLSATTPSVLANYCRVNKEKFCLKQSANSTRQQICSTTMQNSIGQKPNLYHPEADVASKYKTGLSVLSALSHRGTFPFRYCVSSSHLHSSLDTRSLPNHQLPLHYPRSHWWI